MLSARQWVADGRNGPTKLAQTEAEVSSLRETSLNEKGRKTCRQNSAGFSDTKVQLDNG